MFGRTGLGIGLGLDPRLLVGCIFRCGRRYTGFAYLSCSEGSWDRAVNMLYVEKLKTWISMYPLLLRHTIPFTTSSTPPHQVLTGSG